MKSPMVSLQSSFYLTSLLYCLAFYYHSEITFPPLTSKTLCLIVSPYTTLVFLFYSFNIYWLSNHCILNSMPGSGDTVVNKSGPIFANMKLIIFITLWSQNGVFLQHFILSLLLASVVLTMPPIHWWLVNLYFETRHLS